MPDDFPKKNALMGEAFPRRNSPIPLGPFANPFQFYSLNGQIMHFRQFLSRHLVLAAVAVAALLAVPDALMAQGRGGGGGGKNKAALSVTITPQSITEGGSPATGTVTRENSNINANLTVTLESSPDTQATVDAQVTILAGQVSADFDVMAVDDNVKDGDQLVTISVSATDHEGASVSITVVDDEGVPQVVYLPTFVDMPYTSLRTVNCELNEFGMACGYFEIEAGIYHGWLYDPEINASTAIDLNDLEPDGLPEGWYIQTALDLNNNGLVVGSLSQFGSPTNRRGYVLDLITGTLYELPNEGFARPYAKWVNDNGDVVFLDASTDEYRLYNPGLTGATPYAPESIEGTVEDLQNTAQGELAQVYGVENGLVWKYTQGGSWDTIVPSKGEIVNISVNSDGDIIGDGSVTEEVAVRKNKTELVTTRFSYRNSQGAETFVPLGDYDSSPEGINDSGTFAFGGGVSDTLPKIYTDTYGVVELSSLLVGYLPDYFYVDRINSSFNGEFGQLLGYALDGTGQAVILTPYITAPQSP